MLICNSCTVKTSVCILCTSTRVVNLSVDLVVVMLLVPVIQMGEASAEPCFLSVAEISVQSLCRYVLGCLLPHSVFGADQHSGLRLQSPEHNLSAYFQTSVISFYRQKCSVLPLKSY